MFWMPVAEPVRERVFEIGLVCFAYSAVYILDFHDNFDEKYRRKMVV